MNLENHIEDNSEFERLSLDDKIVNIRKRIRECKANLRKDEFRVVT